MASLFISYSRKDIETARKLTKAFEGQGLDFWIDWEGIPPTVDWWNEIQKGIEEADIFLFLISPDSVKSKICLMEIAHAVKNGKRLIPIIARNIKGNEAPPELSHLNWIYFRKSDDFDASLRKLFDAIKSDYEWAQTHRRLQVRALDWERSQKDSSFLLWGKDLQNAEIHLVANSANQPYPTSLQREYVLRSRQVSDRQRTAITAIIIVGAIIMAVLAVFGFVQARLANERANIALARQLASQAESVDATQNLMMQVAAKLIAIQSLKLFPTADASSFLINSDLSDSTISHMIHDYLVYSVAFSPDGRYVVSGSMDNTARVWEVATGKEVNRVNSNYEVYSVAFSPDGKYVVSGGCDKMSGFFCAQQGSARVWETFTGKEVAHMTHDDAVRSVSFSLDGKYVVSGSDDKTVRIWEVATGKEVTLITLDYAVYSVAFSPDGKCVVVSGGSNDGTKIQVWEVATGKEVIGITLNYDINSVAFSPDGKYIVSGSNNHTVQVWETVSGKEVAHMTHAASVSSVAFSPDGKYVVSGSIDNTVRIWEVATGVEVAHRIHDSRVSSVAFSPDGKYVVSGSFDDTVLVWVWRAEDLIAYGCASTLRNLTRAEWQQYIGDALPYQPVCDNLPIEPESPSTP